MQIGRVCGTVVSTLKHAALGGHKLLLVQPHGLDGVPRGRVTAAVDVVDAGPGDWVLLHDEGSGASQILGNPRGADRARRSNPRRDKGLTGPRGSGRQAGVGPDAPSPTGRPCATRRHARGERR